MALKWGKRALWYKQNNELPFTLSLRSAIPFLQNLSPSKICEVACGPGSNLETLRHLFPETPIYASDLEPEMVNFAYQKKVPNTFVRIADNHNLPYKQNDFDLYIASFSVNLVPYPQKMLSEAYRVLKSGGSAFFAVAGRLSLATYTQVMINIVQYEVAGQDHDLTFRFGDKKFAVDTLSRHGFREIITYPLKIPMPIVSTEQMLQHYNGYHTFEKLDKDQKESVKKAIEQILVENEPFYFDTRAILCKK